MNNPVPNDELQHQPPEKKKAWRWPFSPKERSLLIKLGIIVILGLLLLSFSKFTSSSSPQPAASSSPPPAAGSSSGGESSTGDLEQKLTAVLGRIKGAGEVTVALTYKTAGEREYAYNQQNSERSNQEQDAEGGQSHSLETSKATTLVMNNEQPVVVREGLPQVQGVVVVAAGAGDPEVARRLYEAVRGLVDVPAHRIMVIEGNLKQ